MCKLGSNKLIPCPSKAEFDFSIVAMVQMKASKPIMDSALTVNAEPNMLQTPK
jgi:hypothetical protein